MSLSKEGKPVSDEGYFGHEKWEDLPEGNYVLHVTYIENTRRQSDTPVPTYAPLEIPFVIDENSPAEIDLGELRLKEAKESL